jgi:adenosine deaminase
MHTEAKVELHCHLLGTIDAPLLLRVRAKGVGVLVDPDALRKCYPIRHRAAFQRWLQLLRPYQAECFESMRAILSEHISNLIKQHVVYSEIMLSPAIFPKGETAMVSALERWREWTRELERGKVQIEYLMSIPRSLSSPLLEHDAKRFVELRRRGLIVGVALVGMETGESLSRFSRAFSLWRDAGLGIEIHAGEHLGPESVYDALRFANPNRIGHCLSAFRDPALVESIKRQGIHIEFCPTSNLCTAAMSTLKGHPIKEAKELGLSFSINTDNPGAFRCSIESEHRLLAETLQFTADDFGRAFLNSLDARFEKKLRYLDLGARRLPMPADI